MMGEEENCPRLLRRVRRVETMNTFVIFVLSLLCYKQIFPSETAGSCITKVQEVHELINSPQFSQLFDVILSEKVELDKHSNIRKNIDRRKMNDVTKVVQSKNWNVLETKYDPSVDSRNKSLIHSSERPVDRVPNDNIKTNADNEIIDLNSNTSQSSLSDVWKIAKRFNETFSLLEKVSTQRNNRALIQSDTNSSCNGTHFHLELYLGSNMLGTSWEIKNDNSTIIAIQNYRFQSDLDKRTFSTCLIPGVYTFTLSDESRDGSSCNANGPRCYSIFLDNHFLRKGVSFDGRNIMHTFDTTSSCMFGNTITFALDYNFSKAILWSILDRESGDTVVFEPLQNDSNETDSYLACIPSGIYSYEIFTSTGEEISCAKLNRTDECFNMKINDSFYLSISDYFLRTGGYFYANIDGTIHEQICPLNPILSPMNAFNEHEFDENISNKLDLIYSLSSFDKVHNPSTPQYKAACFMVYDDTNDSQVLNNQWIERYAFCVFLYSIQQLAELIPRHICDYDENRFECDDLGNIKAIEYNGFEIYGKIPLEIGFFPQLKRVDLTDNYLEGSIPPSIGDLLHLQELSLERNNLVGPLFPEIGNLINLELLLLGRNSIDGKIPTEIGSCARLRELVLDFNGLTGPIPSQIYTLTELSRLLLSNNNLDGTISSRVNSLRKLEKARLENNAFHGTIPTEFGSLPLIWLFLSNNFFSGTFPEEIGNIVKLQKVMLGYNQLTGTIFDAFENFNELKTLDFSHNMFSGTIPSSFWQLESLKEINLKGNNFIGVAAIDNCTKYDVLGIDNSMWLDDKPIVECTCCVIEECHVWESTGDPTQTPCPQSNIHMFDFYNLYKVEDLQAQTVQSRGNFETLDKAKVCLSPTGCYKLSYRDETRNMIEYDMSFSTKSNSLVIESECEAVSVCNDSFPSSDHRRSILNHLTQTVIPDFTQTDDGKYESLCWMLTSDKKLHNYQICDGTLLQRFVVAAFFVSSGFMANLNELSSIDTCQWPGITCDSNQKFVEVINLEDKELDGFIISEIGYLTSLRVINLSNNRLGGTLDPRIFSFLPTLEVFNIQRNRLKRDIPKELITLPRIREISAYNNLFDGSIPDSIEYSKGLQYINLANNILRGHISTDFFAPPGLKYFDVSENVLDGTIPSEIGLLKNLEIAKFGRNRLSGSIPQELFESMNIEEFMLQGNRITGSVPANIGNLQNARMIFLNHNVLKGTIPKEISKLKNLTSLHLHHNKFTSTIPRIESSAEEFNFIADCESEVFELDCPSCNWCCDDEEKCTPHDSEAKPFYHDSLIYFLAIPFGTAFFLLLFNCVMRACSRSKSSKSKRDASECILNAYSDDTVYSYIFSSSPMAWFIHMVTLLVQVSLYFSFLWASDPTNDLSLVQPFVICLSDSDKCIIIRIPIEKIGWTLFFVMTLLYLGPDIIEGVLQIRVSFISPFDPRFLINGLALLGLSAVSVTASISFNFATAETNTDLIINAVILLFINDLDEQAMKVLEKIAPFWNEERVEEVKNYMMKRHAIVREKQSFHKKYFDDNKDSNSAPSSFDESSLEHFSSKKVDVSFVENFRSFDDVSTSSSLEDPSRLYSRSIVAFDGSIETRLHNNQSK